MRLAVLGMSHETNTFSPVPASYDAFAVYRGDEIVAQYRDSHATIAGYLEAAETLGFEAVPLVFAVTGPIGTITKEAFDSISDEMIRLLRVEGPWDGVLLAEHGAAVSEEFPDADGEICRRVREAVGPDVPVGMSLDLHTNLSHEMIRHTTATVLYRSNPHLDPRPRAYECAEIIYRTIKGEVRPVQWLETPPLVINIVKQFTGEEPMASLIRDCNEVIERPGILSASVGEGYPYADVPEMGAAFLAVADGDEARAKEAAQWMASRAWERRAEFVGDIPSAEEALRHAAGAPAGPIILMDVGDNIGAGSSADSTFLLAEAQRLGVRSYLQTLYDPEAVRQCVAAGPGADLTLKVGGKTDNMHGSPVEVTGHVRVISDGRFEEPTPTHGGFRFFNGGTTAALDTTDGHTLVLTSRRVGNTSRQQMYSLGIRPEDYQVVVCKGVVSPRGAYQPIAKEILLVNTPGVTTADLDFFTYHHRRKPLYPFEQDATYDPS
ncbi:MAG: M81 family metallopeptidase [Chloroflexota bacterium]